MPKRKLRNYSRSALARKWHWLKFRMTSMPKLVRAKANLIRSGYKRRTRAEVLEAKRIAALPPPLDIDALFERAAKRSKRVIY